MQAALAKYKERKVPLPSKRRSVLAHSSVETCTPPGTDGHVGWADRAFLTPLSNLRFLVRWKILACRKDLEKLEMEMRCPRLGSVCTQCGCPPDFCVGFHVFTKMLCVPCSEGKTLE